MFRSHRWLRGISAVTLGALVVYNTQACGNAPSPARDTSRASPPSPVVQRTDTTVQCYHTWDFRRTPSDSAGLISTIARRDLTHIPEYHDCQRLVQPDRQYGPLVVAFAREGLDDFGAALRAIETRPMNALAAVELLNRDKTSYAPLNIEPGFMCLYVAKSGKGWLAKLKHYGTTQPDCKPPVALSAIDGLSLEVRRRPTESTDFKPEDYPPVVRWEWDGDSRRQYIGFKCDATAWCEAGLPGFKSAPALAVDTGWDRVTRRTFEVRGWLDEQVLAHPPTSGAVMPNPGPTRASVIPHPRLKTFTLDDYAGRWADVAYVVVQAEDPKYVKKLNFVMSTAGAARLSSANTPRISICWAGSGTCRGAPSIAKCQRNESDHGKGRWVARYTAPGRAPVYLCVAYRPHPAAMDPKAPSLTVGSVRWRWLDDDETNWIGCPDGCCETRGGLGGG